MWLLCVCGRDGVGGAVRNVCGVGAQSAGVCTESAYPASTHQINGFAELLVCYEVLRVRGVAVSYRGHAIRRYRDFVRAALGRLLFYQQTNVDGMGANAVGSVLVGLLMTLDRVLHVPKAGAERSALHAIRTTPTYEFPDKEAELVLANKIVALIKEQNVMPWSYALRTKLQPSWTRPNMRRLRQ